MKTKQQPKTTPKNVKIRTDLKAGAGMYDGHHVPLIVNAVIGGIPFEPLNP